MGPIHLDFETFSCVNLKKAGQRNYAAHDSTDVMCLAWCRGDGPVRLWTPDQPMPLSLRLAVERGAPLYAYNAKFEREVWERVMVPFYDWPAVAPNRWHCTAAQTGVCNLGLGLDKAAARLGAAEKDKAGSRVMMWLCSPKRGRRRYEPEKLQKLYDYCKQDVAVERQIHAKLPPLTPEERRIWLLDQKINRRGVPVDIALCRGAVELIKTDLALANDRLRKLTGDDTITVGCRDRILNVLREYHPSLPDLRKATLDGWFAEGRFACDDEAHEIAAIKRRAGLASVKKFQATLDWADDDARCRYTIKHHGAGTGRWAGAGPQFQNMARAKAPAPEALAAITSGDYERAMTAAPDGDVIGLIGQATRSIICAPPDRSLVQSDLSSIEARLVVWLANEEDALHRYHADEDQYIALASKIYGVPPESIAKDSTERLVGKIGVLGLGYRAAAVTFRRNCREQFGLDVSEEFAQQVVDVYRGMHPRVVALWRNLDRAAVMAVERWKPVGLDHHVGDKICLIPRRYGGHDWLTIRLPSGRLLWYLRPHVVQNAFGGQVVEHVSPKGPKEIHGGVLLQNICEGIGRDLLAGALLANDERHIYSVLTVHDSIFAEIDEHDTSTPELVHDTLQQHHPWTGGLPIRTETKTFRRMQ